MFQKVTSGGAVELPFLPQRPGFRWSGPLVWGGFQLRGGARAVVGIPPRSIWPWLKIKRGGGPTAGFWEPCFHLLGFHFGIPVS